MDQLLELYYHLMAANIEAAYSNAYPIVITLNHRFIWHIIAHVLTHHEIYIHYRQRSLYSLYIHYMTCS
jgi:hypothetical protein